MVLRDSSTTPARARSVSAGVMPRAVHSVGWTADHSSYSGQERLTHSSATVDRSAAVE